ncbi:MAG: CRISPR-associated endonuclease Cas1 [Gemmatimonadales bacterium]|nr:CRISPR-associated endonuclease Cas1 [Gemmatimonadales bacterium]
MLEAELDRLACDRADPAAGVLHADQRARDPFACDFMEAVPPAPEGYLFDLLARRVFARREFFEAAERGCGLRHR